MDPHHRAGRGILSEPIDLNGPRRPRRTFPEHAATVGLRVKLAGTPVSGTVLECLDDRVQIRERDGSTHWVRLSPGGFDVDGQRVTLIRPATAPSRQAPQRTASGSIAVPDQRAKVARASRIMVEGKHDAELIERVWGDDLRDLGIVVEALDGADNLEEVVRTFGPGPGRRLGVLVDHLVEGSKESRLAAAIDHPDVCITGHPYIDIWQAVKPSVIGLSAWPVVPRGVSWKEGTLAAIGQTRTPAEFWQYLLAQLNDWTQLEAPLIGAVETLIDFVEAT